MKTIQKHATKKEKKKERKLKKCYPEMVLEDKNCPARNKRKPPKWSEVFPNNVCLCKCKTKVEEEKEKVAAEIEKQVRLTQTAVNLLLFYLLP